MFDGFTLEDIGLPEATLPVRHGGRGSPFLLLHGHPPTHATWHRVAPSTGSASYGRLPRPARVRPLIETYGHARPRGLIGTSKSARSHGLDAPSRTAFRTARDHPQAITHLGSLDGMPILETPERVIVADPDAWYGGSPDAMGAEACDDFRAVIHDPDTGHGMIEDYRAGLGIDREHDEADRRAGRRVACPTFILWSVRDDLERLYGDELAVWEPWATMLRGRGLDCGHHMAEEAPDELAAEMPAFLRSPQLYPRAWLQNGSTIRSRSSMTSPWCMSSDQSMSHPAFNAAATIIAS